MNNRVFLQLGALAIAAIVLYFVFWRKEDPAPPNPAPRIPAVIPEPPSDPYLPPRGYVCFRADAPIIIDGKIDEAAWAAAPWSEDFVDIEGDKKPKPRFRTRVKMLWDDDNLYIAAELEEPHVQGTYLKHDSYIFHEDNDFEVFLDPDGDNQLYAELEMNALNTTWDLLLTKPYRDGGKAIDAWEIDGLRKAVQVQGTINNPGDKDRGWTLEIAWPWKGLEQIANCPVPPRDGDQWRINFARVEWEYLIKDGKYVRAKDKPEQNWVWSPQGAINMHVPERWGYLQFSTAKRGTAKFQPDPAGSLKHALFRIYQAQAEFRKLNGRWATTLNELGLQDLRGETFGNPRLESTTHGYTASLELLPPGKGERWAIANDSRIFRE